MPQNNLRMLLSYVQDTKIRKVSLCGNRNKMVFYLQQFLGMLSLLFLTDYNPDLFRFNGYLLASMGGRL